MKLEPRFDDSVVAQLRRVGHDLDIVSTPYADTFGHAGALIRRKDGRIEAGHDPRSDGGCRRVLRPTASKFGNKPGVNLDVNPDGA